MVEGETGQVWVVGRPWYVVATMPNAEELACRTIGRIGIETFVPQVRLDFRLGRVEREVLRPMFRNYVFATFDVADDGWHHVARCHGVSRIITLADSGRAGTPARLPSAMVDALQARGPMDLTRPKVQDFQCGETVRIVEGPFAQLLGKIAALDSRGRCVLLLRILGGDVRVQSRVARIAKQ